MTHATLVEMALAGREGHDRRPSAPRRDRPRDRSSLARASPGPAWGFVADRIAARWPAHEDGSIRAIDWRTPVAVIVGGIALALCTVRFEGDSRRA